MILRAALDARLFDFMTVPEKAEYIARRAGTDPEMTGLVCDALVGMGFAERIGNTYRNTDSANHYLVSVSGLSLKHTYDMIHGGLESWGHIGDALRDGNYRVPEDPDRFYRSMTAFGEFSKGGFIAVLMNFIEDDWMTPASGTPIRRQKHIPQRYISRKHRKYGTPPLSNRERIGACACPFAVSGVQQENPGALSLNAPLGENTIPNGGPLKKQNA